MNSLIIILLLLSLMTTSSDAQYQPTPNDDLTSVAITPDKHVTFSIYAPNASAVKLGGGDIPEAARTSAMTKQPNGVWSVTVGPLAPGAYRYNFNVDGVTVNDPRNSAVSESNDNTWSLMYVPGAAYMETNNVPHGAVAEVTYYSTALGRSRRMHVYTPPGYENGSDKYPVFYLLHGAYDCDDSWTTVGRAAFILDNLIAEKKAVPMVVVMPAGHTGQFGFGKPMQRITKNGKEEFIDDFVTDVKPYAEAHYRVLTDRKNRAIAGLSMGGAQTINIAIPNLSEYAYVGVFSSGIFELSRGVVGPGTPQGPSWEERHITMLDDKNAKQGLKLFWFATGKDDFLLKTSQLTVDLFKKHGFDVVYKETAGAHTWLNWREYLAEFAPKLFKEM
jgi:enterochelin esterase family protein